MRSKRSLGITAPVISSFLLVVTGLAKADTISLEKMEISDPGSNQESYKVEQMGTATKFDLTSMETPQSVSVMTNVQMEDFGLFDLNSAIDNIAGLNVESVETDRTYYISRGFVVTNFQVDGLGMPLSNESSHGNFDTAIYDRVEVVRGASGLMNGAGEPSATINFVRKRPTAKFQGDITATLGSWDKKRLEADVSGALTENVRLRSVVVNQKNDSYLDWYSQHRKAQYGIMEVDVTDNTLFTLSYSHQSSESDSPLWGALTLHATDGTPIEYDVSASSSNEWAFWDARVTNRYFDLTHRFNNDWQIKAAYTDMHVDEDSELFYVYSWHLSTTPPGEVISIGSASRYQRNQDQELFDIYARGPWTLLGREHELAIGYSKSKVRTQDLSLFDFSTGNGNVMIGDLQEWDGSSPRPTFVDGARGGTVKDFQESIYGSVKLNPLDNLSLLLGARMTDWSSKGEYYGNDKATSYDDVVTPFAGVVFNLTDNFMAYTSYSEIFRPQNERDINGNRLDPVDGETIEIGFKSELLKDQLLATIAYFETDQKNLAKSAGINPDTSQKIFEAADGIASEGYELEIAGQINRDWTISASYTYVNVDASNVGDKNIENYTPSKLFKLATRYQVPAMPKLKVGANLKWKGEFSRDYPDTIASDIDDRVVVLGTDIKVKQEAYYLLDLMAQYQFSDNLTATFNANNLTNEKYLTSLYWGQSYYGKPRHYQVSLKFDF